MGATEKRMEQLGIRLQQTDWRGKGTVDAVLAGDMLYLSAHYPVNEQGEPVYQGRVGAEVTQEEAYQKLLPRIHPGAIVLLHVTSQTNGEIMDELLTKWEDKGYSFKRVDQLT